MERLLRFVWPSDYYALLLFHVGTNETARGDLERMKYDYRALGVRLKGMGALVVFFLILAVMRKSLRKNGWMLWVSNSLHSWCQQQRFVFYDMEPSLRIKDC